MANLPSHNMMIIQAWRARLLLCFALLLTVCLPAVSVQAAAEVPILERHITDQTGTLTAEQIEQLDSQLVALEKRKGAQLVVLMVSTTEPQDIEGYSLAVAEANKIGRKGTDDGILLLVAKDDRRDRIEVGYGLEGAVPDAAAARIQREFIESRFKQGDFFGGIRDGVDALTKLIDGEELPPPTATSSSSSQGLEFEDIGFVGLAIALIFRSMARGFPWLVRMGIGGLISAIFVGFLLSSLGAALIGGIFGAVLMVLPYGAASIGGGSGRGGGFGGGGGGFGGGGGGFSGGGGGFGGGGSSGSW